MQRIYLPSKYIHLTLHGSKYMNCVVKLGVTVTISHGDSIYRVTLFTQMRALRLVR